MNLDGASAIVTGGAGGLGAATVARLLAGGLRVVVFDRDAQRAADLAAELGAGAVGVGGDVLDDDDVAAAIVAARDLGPLSVLVNVAGGGVGGGRLVGRSGPHDKGSFVQTLEMNATGTFNVSRLVAAAMAENEPDDDGQRGVVVNTASIAGYEGKTGQVAYAAAKAAILGMTLPMARDLAPIGVRVCAIAPGTMGTPLMLAALEHLKNDPSEGIVFPPRMGYPDEFALLVESIVRNPYLNGENIRLDGALRFTAT
jgi:NAD(P)-dependent dehydrogenase (short-subunit alcohol dehydrogenase family)